MTTRLRSSGEAWVGDDYTVASDGLSLVSKDGLRQYRSLSYKPNLGCDQANFEQRFPGQQTRGWQSNGHLDRTNLPGERSVVVCTVPMFPISHRGPHRTTAASSCSSWWDRQVDLERSRSTSPCVPPAGLPNVSDKKASLTRAITCSSSGTSTTG